MCDHRIESGRRIAGYRVVRELGRGGMGTVYEAVHVGLDRPVALKVLGIHAAPDSSARRRFLNEARTAAGLHHTHIVPVFDVGQVGGLCYYAMQRIEGSGLDWVVRHLRRSRPPVAGRRRRAGQRPVRDPRCAGCLGRCRRSTPGWDNLWIRVSSRMAQANAAARHNRTGATIYRRPLEPRCRRHRRRQPVNQRAFSAVVLGDSTASWESRQPANPSADGSRRRR